jgi:hypothetical protein
MPPRVGDAAREAAIQRIQRRHAADDNNDIYLLSEDPREVLRYLRKRGTSALRGDEDSHDVEDALILRLWLWWRGEEDEVWLLNAVEELGLNRRRVGAHLGVKSGQGLVDRREYKRRLLAADATADAEPAEVAVSRETAQQRWLKANRRGILRIAAALVEHWDLAGDDEDVADWLVEVRRDLREQVCTPGSFSILIQAVAAMAAVPAVRELPDSHPLRQALAAWPALDAAYPRAAQAAGSA